ncbi:hypothetical protein GCM10009657_09250 [Oryzihumus leptocrescens]
MAKIAKVTFTSADRVREVIHNFNADSFDSRYPKYKGRSAQPRGPAHPHGRVRAASTHVPNVASMNTSHTSWVGRGCQEGMAASTGAGDGGGLQLVGTATRVASRPCR